METNGIKEAEELRNKGNNLLIELKENIVYKERLYALAQLGLEQMPLERDFMQLVKYKLNDMKSDYEHKKMMIDTLNEFITKQLKERGQDNE